LTSVWVPLTIVDGTVNQGSTLEGMLLLVDSHQGVELLLVQLINILLLGQYRRGRQETYREDKGKECFHDSTCVSVSEKSNNVHGVTDREHEGDDHDEGHESGQESEHWSFLFLISI